MSDEQGLVKQLFAWTRLIFSAHQLPTNLKQIHNPERVHCFRLFLLLSKKCIHNEE